MRSLTPSPPPQKKQMNWAINLYDVLQIINRTHLNFFHSSNAKWCAILHNNKNTHILPWCSICTCWFFNHRTATASNNAYLFSFRMNRSDCSMRIYYYFVYLHLIKMKRSNQALKIINSHEREHSIHARIQSKCDDELFEYEIRNWKKRRWIEAAFCFAVKTKPNRISHFNFAVKKNKIPRRICFIAQLIYF